MTALLACHHLLLQLHGCELPVHGSTLPAGEAHALVHALHVVHSEHLGVLLLSQFLLDALGSASPEAWVHEARVEHGVALGVGGLHGVAHHSHGGHLALSPLVPAVANHHVS